MSYTHADARALRFAVAMPGLKERDLIRLGPCRVCGKSLLEHDGGLTFYRLAISRGIFDPSALRRQVGLALQLGGPLAAVMGPDEDLAKIFDGPHEVVVAEACALRLGHLLDLIPAEPAADADTADAMRERS